MSNEEKQKLLEAMKADDREKVNNLACDHFIDSHGQCNWTNMSAFEQYSGARIVALERDSFGWLIGGIKWNGKVYSYG